MKQKNGLVRDTGQEVIPKSMQLIAGRTAQEYNQRKNRKGVFWEDRYHATAIDKEGCLAQCLVYIDMNRVRAGVVSQMELLGINNLTQLQSEHRLWVEAELKKDSAARKQLWSESLAVVSQAYVQGVKEALDVSAKARQIEGHEGLYRVREPRAFYTCDFDAKNSRLSSHRRLFLDKN
ncbi:hypothetical protein N2488_10050 [SAR92 clade bacterium H231]|nr:hypothetical protein [SAR92 clade bacterium H231]